MDITSANFRTALPFIKNTLKEACFVAFDLELTGLSIDKEHAHNYWDTADKRYQKNAVNFSKLTISQVGLCAIVERKSVEGPVTFMAKPFNFYVKPCSIEPLNRVFTTQMSAIRFLNTYNFDFNKFLREGIEYLNADDIRTIKSLLNPNQSLADLYNLNIIGPQSVTSIMKQVVSAEGLSHTFQLSELNCPEPAYLQHYILELILFMQYPNFCVRFEGETVTVCKRQSIDPLQDQAYFLNKIEDLLCQLTGFSDVFNYLAELQKPLVGHNCLLDLIAIYSSFIAKLPSSLVQFKSLLQTVSPSIYDTKLISSQLRASLPQHSCYTSTHLSGLYNFFKADFPMKGGFNKWPKVQLDTDDVFQKYAASTLPHEAGFDAYMTAFVFINVAHMQCSLDDERLCEHHLTFQHYYKTLFSQRNRIFIHDCIAEWTCLDQPDRPIRLTRLLIRSKTPLDWVLLADELNKFGSMKVEYRDRCSAMLLIPYEGRAREVLRSLKIPNGSVLPYKRVQFPLLNLITAIPVIVGLCFVASRLLNK